MSKFFKKRRTRSWFITTAVLLGLGVTVNSVATSGLLYDVICNVLGGSRAILKPGQKELFAKKTNSKDDAKQAGEKLTEEITGEGIVLLKNENNALPLKEGAKISVFGKNSVNLIYGTSGSGGGDNSEAVKLEDALKEGGFNVNPTLTEFYKSDKSGSGRSKNPSIENGGVKELETGETPISSYGSDITDSYSEYKDAAIIVFARIAGEGFDLPMGDGTSKHYLQLDNNEAALINHVCDQGFEHVIVYINSNNPLECGFLDDPFHYAYRPEIDAALWSGGLGTKGINSLPKILKGEINPSGHLVDTFARDFRKDPVWQNFGVNLKYDGSTGDNYTEGGAKSSYYFVDYEEGIYVGYRYWETRARDEGEYWYKRNVVYPFGYGLSYTNFKWEVLESTALKATSITKDGKIKVKVRVHNEGDVAGKDVVQLYAKLPYTKRGIEKPYEVLAGFAKTELIEPKAYKDVEIEVDPYYLASFDFEDKNKNDFKGYELEKGKYSLLLNKDAHHVVEEIVLPELKEDIKWDKDPVTGTTVTTLFDDIDDHLQTVLSRNNWEGTFPKSPTDDDKDLLNFPEILEKLSVKSTLNPYDEANKTESWYKEATMPKTNTVTKEVEEEVTGEDNKTETIKRKLKLKDLIGKDYNDPLWDDLLNQMSVEEMEEIHLHGAFQTAKADSIGKPKTNESDGPSGFVQFMGDPTIYGTATYCNQIVMAATWNQELSELMGETVGEEGLWGNARGDGLPYSGWYAPGVNIHRGQFGGRVAEYYSEDSFLSGKMAAAIVRGAKSKGVYTMMKHFILNEQETHRADYGSNSWCTEQAFREIYLRPFEIAVKEGGATAVMSSFNRIGTTWAGGDYRLLTNVLREEWGFHGTVICDFNTHPEYMSAKQMAYAGGNLNLANQPQAWVNKANAQDVTVLRENIKGILYTVANSNTFNADIIGYLNPLWVNVMYIVDACIGAVLIAWGAWAIITVYKKEK